MADPIVRLRTVCLALPGASERLSHGEAAFFAGTTPTNARMFVMVDEHHAADRVAFWCAAPEGVQTEMIAEDATRFFRPPYVGPKGWLGVRVDVGVDWDEITEIVDQAFRCVAPASAVRELDARSA